MPRRRDLEREGDPAPGTLPRGRHGLSRQAVLASQRERLLRAMLACVADRGYQATTVSEVVTAARVSRNAFYVLFADKLGCFLALCEELADQLLEETFAPAGEDWTEALRAGARRYLSWWSERPRFARAYLVELPTAGARALEQRRGAYARFAQRFADLAAWARIQQADLAPLRPSAIGFVVLAITEMVAQAVIDDRVQSLPGLEDDVVWLVQRIIAEPMSQNEV